ncbi:hypothetical protein OsJ_13461 [Oryza sativa Japonica Group]|uniref:Uncharacterized protein n=1 Tax=Oryza sativa subsp. japonica TaxID=39947 RepID=B9F810_ORYSJ|nr:hypothetical protein OsJ_13461 [Oryza sativa Japonica Group]
MAAGSGSGSNPKDYQDPPPAPLVDTGELGKWSLYRAAIAEFTATLLLVCISVSTVIGEKRQSGEGGAGVLGIAWAFGGLIFVLGVAAASGAVHDGAVRGRRVRRRARQGDARVGGQYARHGGGANELAAGYSAGAGVVAEMVGTFVLVYTVFSATDPKRKARDSHVPVLAPFPIGLAVLVVHLATIPITGTGINPARSLGPALVLGLGTTKAWSHLWIFWVGPFAGAAAAMIYHHYILRGAAAKAFASSSYRSPHF